MLERVVGKAGGTSNCDANAVQVSLEWAEQTKIFVPSAPGKLGGESGPSADKVTNMLLRARSEFEHDGDVAPATTDLVTARFSDIVNGLGVTALPARWLDSIPARIQETARHSEDAVSILGERLQAEIYAAYGFRLLDPGQAPHDLGSDPQAWRGWLGSVYRPGERHVLIGNTTRVHKQLRAYSRGGSDTSSGFAAYGIAADLNLNLTDGGAKTADPALVGEANARHLDHLLYVEGRELGRNGTGLVHPAAMVPLMLGNIPTHIRSTLDRRAPFTVLDNDNRRAERRAGRVAALSLMDNVVIHRVHEPGMAEAVGRLGALESALANEGIPVIDSQGDGVDAQKYFVDAKVTDKAAEILNEQVLPGGTVETSQLYSFITLVGYRLEKNIIRRLADMARGAGINNGQEQSDAYPISLGRHSLRLGVPPARASEILDDLHQQFIG